MTTRNVKKRKHKDRKIKPNRNKTFKNINCGPKNGGSMNVYTCYSDA